MKCSEKSKNKQECKKQIKKHGGGKNIKFWGFFGAYGLGNIVQVEGNLTGAKYRQILDENFSNAVEKMEIENEFENTDIRIIQDNDPKHKNKIAQNFFNENPYELLDFPPSSPDLNTIEHLWAYLKKEVDKKSLKICSNYEQQLKKNGKILKTIR